MIRYFRRLRQELLSKNGHSTYFLYAIGEIVLVMIGILLALQVNNWSEERKIKKTVATYKKSLSEDLKKEIIKSRSAISDMEEELNELESFSERISHNSLNIDTIINIYRYEFSLEINPANLNVLTLNALVSTGNINLLEDELYSSLMKLNDVLEKTVQNIEINKEFFMIYSTRINLPFNDDWNAFGGEALERVWEDIDKNAFLRDFNATLSSKILINKFIIEAQKKLINEIESVLRMLNEKT